MTAKLADRINRIATDTVHGASWLTRYAIATLSLAIRESQAQTANEFIKEIEQVTSTIARARPSMVSIANCTHLLFTQILLEAKHEKDVSNLKLRAVAKTLELAKALRQALSKTVEYASVIIEDNDTIATCSYSSTVCQVFKLAKSRDTKFQVLVAQSKLGNTSYGEYTATELAAFSIPVKVFNDTDINQKIAKASKTLIGADAITIHGYLINGTPSLALAQASRTKRVPLYVVCETAKFDFYDYATGNLELGFDHVPLDMCTAVITEKGTMIPELVIAYIKQKVEEGAGLLREQE